MVKTRCDDTRVRLDRLIPFREGCTRLCVSVRTAHRLRGREGFPPTITVGGRLKFRESDIDNFIASGGLVNG